MSPTDEEHDDDGRFEAADPDELVRRLGADDPATRREAALEVARRADESTEDLTGIVTALGEHLGNDHAVVRTQVASAFVPLAQADPDGAAAYVPELAARLDDEYLLVREHALGALFAVASHDPGRVAPVADRLVEQLGAEASFVRTRAVDVLLHVARASPGTLREHVPALVDGLAERFDADEVTQSVRAESRAPTYDRDDLILAIGEDEWARHESTREGVALVLATVAAEFPDALVAHVPAVAAHVDDESMLVRKSAAEVLACVAEVAPDAVADAVPALRERFHDDEYHIVRARAAWALSLLAGADQAVVEDPTATLDAVDELLGSDEPEVRLAAVGLLAEVVDAGVVDAGVVDAGFVDGDATAPTSLRETIDALVDDDTPRVRQQAVWVFEALGDDDARRSVETIREDDPDAETRELAGHVLEAGSWGRDGE